MNELVKLDSISIKVISNITIIELDVWTVAVREKENSMNSSLRSDDLVPQEGVIRQAQGCGEGL